jgi:hypothetical protein
LLAQGNDLKAEVVARAKEGTETGEQSEQK